MTDSTAPTRIDDDSRIGVPSDRRHLIRRVRDLSTQQYVTSWMRLEIAALAVLLDEETITAGEVWQLVLPFYNMSPTVQSDRDPDESEWLKKPLEDRSMVWAHLTVLCAEQEIAPVPELPGPYDELPNLEALLKEITTYHLGQLNFLSGRFEGAVRGRNVFEGLAHDLRHDIEHSIALEWFDGPESLGATLHAKPLPGFLFGSQGQAVYIVKALLRALQREISDYQALDVGERALIENQAILGRARLWWGILKGYVYESTQSSLDIVVQHLSNEPSLVDEIKTALTVGLELLKTGGPTAPTWSATGFSSLEREITNTPTAGLVAKLGERVTEAARLNAGPWD